MSPAGRVRPSRREIHGLVRHIRRVYPDPAKRPEGRDLIGPLGAGENDPLGICVWCGYEAPTPRKRWHDDCALGHAAARGITVAGFRYLVKPEPCELCGGKVSEVDHEIALGVARRIWTPGIVVRAWSRGNLRWLCHACHRRKTKKDLAIIAAIDRARNLPPLTLWPASTY